MYIFYVWIVIFNKFILFRLQHNILVLEIYRKQIDRFNRGYSFLKECEFNIKFSIKFKFNSTHIGLLEEEFNRNRQTIVGMKENTLLINY